MTEAPKVEQELLPCPFCGAADGRIEQAYVRATDDFAIWTVECLDCGADISDDESQTAADRHWNTRATLTEPERTAKAVAETVEPYRSAIAAVIPSAAGLANQPDSHVLPFYITLGELRGLRVLAAIRNEGPKL